MANELRYDLHARIGPRGPACGTVYLVAASSGRNSIEEVRAATDIVEVVSGYLPLKKSGAGFSACCPFHREKTPSFHVSPTRQTFHCFGCHESGTVFDFVMKMERVEFAEALRVLAERAGVVLDGRGAGEDRAPLIAAHSCAQDLFRSVYKALSGTATREYVAKRGISPEMAEAWGLGMAPEGWSGLVDAAAARSISSAVLERSGLALPGSTRPGHYDRFRGRLTFPIKDSFGRIVAFGARSLDGSEPKYLNSPETPIFSKGRMLYGIERLKHHPRTAPVLVMEGYTDVIMSTQAGVPGCVATLGTAMTSAHARILSRYTERIILVYDGDKAGLAAAERGARLLLEGGQLDIQVAVLPDGQDPCDFFLARGEAGVPELLGLTVPLVEFLLDRVALRHDLTQISGRLKAAHELARNVAAVSDPVARELLLARVAERLGVSTQALQQRVVAEVKEPRPSEQGEQHAASAWVQSGPKNARKTASLWIVQAALNEPAFAASLTIEQIACVPAGSVRSILETMASAAANAGATPGSLLDSIEDPALREMARRALLPENHGHDLSRMGLDALASLSRETGRGEVQRLQERLGDDPEALAELSRRYRASKSGQPGSMPGLIPDASS
ncbi:MAG: DNA primase [Planctomycetes bacterium]|nr:DNA primase [Planctomycetota bacterium]